jgi:hypothetical protein
MIIKSTSVDGQHELKLDEEAHRYYMDGKRCAGTTTVGGAYPKGEGLLKWMIRQGIEAYESGKKMKDAADIGTLVHDYAYSLEKGLEFDWNRVLQHKDAKKVNACIEQFKKWKETNTDEVLMSEFIVGSPLLRVGGKIDSLRKRGDVVILSDWKTAKKVYVSALHQLALYRRMCREWLGIKVDALEIVRFGKDGTLEVAYADDSGLTIDGRKFDHPGLLIELEQQAERNALTYRHQAKVEKILTNYYEEQY